MAGTLHSWPVAGRGIDRDSLLSSISILIRIDAFNILTLVRFIINPGIQCRQPQKGILASSMPTPGLKAEVNLNPFECSLACDAITVYKAPSCHLLQHLFVFTCLA
jgi:hypothetical protein